MPIKIRCVVSACVNYPDSVHTVTHNDTDQRRSVAFSEAFEDEGGAHHGDAENGRIFGAVRDASAWQRTEALTKGEFCNPCVEKSRIPGSFRVNVFLSSRGAASLTDGGQQ